MVPILPPSCPTTCSSPSYVRAVTACAAHRTLTRATFQRADQYKFTSPSPPPSPPVLGPPPPSPAPPSPPAASYTTHVNTSRSFYYAGAYFVPPSAYTPIDDARTWTIQDTNTNDKRGLVWTKLDRLWSLSCSDSAGPFVNLNGPNGVIPNYGTAAGVSSYRNSIANLITQCQDMGAKYGFDHVYLERLRRITECEQDFFGIATSCWGCDSRKNYCDYYSGGAVQYPSTCSSTLYRGLPYSYVSSQTQPFNSTYYLPPLQKCTSGGCRYCKTADNKYQKVMQVYRRTPSGTQATANIPLYLGVNPSTSTFLVPRYVSATATPNSYPILATAPPYLGTYGTFKELMFDNLPGYRGGTGFDGLGNFCGGSCPGFPWPNATW